MIETCKLLTVVADRVCWFSIMWYKVSSMESRSWSHCYYHRFW